MKNVLVLVAIFAVGITAAVGQTTQPPANSEVPQIELTPVNQDGPRLTATPSASSKAATPAKTSKSKSKSRMKKGKGCCASKGTYSKAKCGGKSKAECMANCEKDHAHNKKNL